MIFKARLSLSCLGSLVCVAHAAGAETGASTATTAISLGDLIRDPEVVADLAQSRFEADTEELLRDLVRIPTVAGDAPSRARFGDRIERAATDLGLTFERIDEDHAFVISMPGPSLVPDFWILAHGDVVPADESAWPVPPFEAAVRGDTLFGRGTLDDKGAVAAALYAIAAVRESNARLIRKPLLVVGMAEETDWRGVQAVLADKKAPDFAVVVDGDYPLTIGERGYVDIAVTAAGGPRDRSPRLVALEGGTASNVVPAKAVLRATARRGRGAQLETDLGRRAKELSGAESGLSFTLLRENDGVTLTFHGRAAHGSTPDEGRNAIAPALRIAAEAGLLAGSWAELVPLMGKLETDGRNLGIASSVDCLGATTVNLGKVSTEGDRLSFWINIRPTTEQSVTEIVAQVEKRLATHDEITIETVSGDGLDAFLGAAKDPLAMILLGSYNEETDREDQPVCIGGTTYAKAFLDTKTLAVGFGPADPTRGEDALYHADPEYILLSALRRNLRIYARAFMHVATSPHGVLPSVPGSIGRTPEH
ncbi:MAG: hypothetical protein CME06_07715 [Gemmatimonadetes bacterium]|nr:hypothetical protein [Gemmatimonadota bacterium]